MEETKKEVVEETTQKEQPKVDNKVEKIKIKKPKKFSNLNEDVKIDLTKPVENKTEEPVKVDLTENKEKVEAVEEIKEEQPKEEVKEEAPVIEEITEEEVDKKVEDLVEETKEAIAEAQETGKDLPENIQKLVDFMEETGGDINDYVRLNQDYSTYDDNSVLREYYKQTKKHLTDEEISFLMEDSFSYNEEEDDDREIKRKKLALKEQVASARAHLDGQKSKYYEEIKAGSKLTKEQQKALDFFNRYNKESEENKKVIDNNTKIFDQKTNNLFSNNFKGFSFDVGEKKFRFNVKNIDEVKQKQSNLQNFMTKFVDKNSALVDAEGYHKSLFTAMNADAIAKHFYEQGKADALKESIAKSKNVDMKPRQSFGEVEAGGMKVKVLGDNSNDFKFKIRNNK